jgi:hypothetical protein
MLTRPAQESRNKCGDGLEYMESGRPEPLVKKRNKGLEQVDVVHPSAAGLDLGSREIWGCVPVDRDSQPGRALP